MTASTGQIIGAAREVHHLLGPGLLPSVYEEALCRELALRNIPFERQKPIEILYKDHPILGQRLDLIVLGRVIVEIKSAQVMKEYFSSQLRSFLRGTGLRNGLVLNFGMPCLADGILFIHQ